MSRVIFYSPQLFITLGTGTQGALVATIVTGVVNHFATYVSLWAADAYGRRILWMEAGVQVCASPENHPLNPSSFNCPGCALRPCFVGCLLPALPCTVSCYSWQRKAPEAQAVPCPCR